MKNTNKKYQSDKISSHEDAKVIHIPVLLDEVIEYLDPKPGEVYLDLTAGYGGHASKVLESTLQDQLHQASLLIDRDQSAIDSLSKLFGQRPYLEITKNDFYSASKDLEKSKRHFDMILVDLGVSSPHLNIASRGFSFVGLGPLDMRMDQTQAKTAEEVVNTYSQRELESILRAYGEEPKAKKISELIVQNRPIHTTHELAKLVARAWPGHSKINPATRTFQAIRIEVNDELKQLESALPIWIDLLAPGGRLAIITFHSLEDRIVKRFLSDVAGDRYDTELTLLTKRPIQGTQKEIAFNPRARSAKLRVVKNKNKERG